MHPTEDPMPTFRYLRASAHRRYSTVLLAAATVVLSGCSTGAGNKPTAVAPAPTAEQRSEQPSGAIALSPGGVTTKIDVPAQSTEEQYAQSCMITKEWMAAKGGDPHTLIEPYLKDLQTSATNGPATFGKTWAELDDAHRAAVIVAVRAAADGGC